MHLLLAANLNAMTIPETVSAANEIAANAKIEADDKAAAAVNGNAAAKADAVAAKEVAVATANFAKDVSSAVNGDKAAAQRVVIVIQTTAKIALESGLEILENLKKTNASEQNIAEAQVEVEKRTKTADVADKAVKDVAAAKNESSLKIASATAVSSMDRAKIVQIASRHLSPVLAKDDFYSKADESIENSLNTGINPENNPDPIPMMPSSY